MSKALWLVFLLGFMSGTSLIASRFSVGQYSSSNYLTVRMAIASLCYAILIFFTQKGKLRQFPRDKQFWIWSVIVGLLTGISLNAIIMAMQYISSGINSILLAVAPAFTVLVAHNQLADERLSIRKVIGIVFALIGIVIMIASGENGLPNIETVNSLGYGLSLGGTLIGSLSAIYLRKHLANYEVVHVSSVRNFFALLVSALLSLAFFGFDFSRVDSLGYTVLVYAALIGTFAAHLLNVYINQQYGATILSMITYVIPMITIIGGVLLLGEQMTIMAFLGMGFILVGIFVINGNFTRKRDVQA